MSGLGAGYVRQTPLEPGVEIGYAQIFLASWIGNKFLTICTSATHSMNSP
jgi:hypothetical protein